MSPLPSSCRSPEESVLRPIIFLDFDDVICLNKHYGGYDVFAPDPPDELWQQLFHPPAIAVLQALAAG